MHQPPGSDTSCLNVMMVEENELSHMAVKDSVLVNLDMLLQTWNVLLFSEALKAIMFIYQTQNFKFKQTTFL
jgi:hypothetical protein